MGKFLDAHPNLYNAKEIDEIGQTYRKLTPTGAIVEHWQKDKKGEWHDITEISKQQQVIENEKKKLKVLNLRKSQMREDVRKLGSVHKA